MSDHDNSGAARVVVGVSGSLGSLTALGRTAREARCRGAELWPVPAWEPPGGQLAASRSTASCVQAYEWREPARERLLTALRRAFGERGHGVVMCALVAQGTPGRALVDVADRADDVLVVGAGRRGPWHRAFGPSVSRYCLAHARCPVLAVPPSPLESELAALHRRNAWRLRLDTREVTDRPESVRPES
ncbi:universal stress protein [Streptomyces sp. NPDC059861]|uniref:universal stress protein n=1 Tax=Streptomyces sp. NPDC059861 TaxID=3346974 RepID=UPI0036590B9F